MTEFLHNGSTEGSDLGQHLGASPDEYLDPDYSHIAPSSFERGEIFFGALLALSAIATAVAVPIYVLKNRHK